MMLVAESGQNNDTLSKTNLNNKNCSSSNNIKLNNNLNQNTINKNLSINNNNNDIKHKLTQIASTSSGYFNNNRNNNNNNCKEFISINGDAIRSSINCNKKLQSISSKPLEITKLIDDKIKNITSHEKLKTPNYVPPTKHHRNTISTEATSVDSLKLEMCHFKPIKSMPISPLKRSNAKILRFPMVKRLKANPRKCSVFIGPKKGPTPFILSKASAFYLYNKKIISVEIFDDDGAGKDEVDNTKQKPKKTKTKRKTIGKLKKSKLNAKKQQKNVKNNLRKKQILKPELKNLLNEQNIIKQTTTKKSKKNSLQIEKNDIKMNLRSSKRKQNQFQEVNKNDIKVNKTKKIVKKKQERLDFELAKKLQNELQPIATRLRTRAKLQQSNKNEIQLNNNKKNIPIMNKKNIRNNKTNCKTASNKNKNKNKNKNNKIKSASNRGRPKKL